MPILGNVGHAQDIPLTDGHMGDVLAAKGNFAGNHRLQARETVHQLRLAIAIDTGDAHDLALAHLKAHIPHGVLFMQLAGHGQMLHIQHHVSGICRTLHHMEIHIMAHHHGAELLHTGVLGLHSADVLTLTQHSTAVGHGHDLVKLVGNEQDGLSLCGQIPHDLHELIDLLGGQHGGRLVENEDLILPVQHLQNFGTLLHTHGDVLDECIGVNLQPIPLTELHNLGTGLFFLQKAHLCGLHTHDDVIQHSKALHQLKVLVYHTDTQGICIIGVFNGHLHAVLFDDALLSLVQAEQNAHQRRFARAVFAQQSMDLTLLQLKRDVVIGDDTGKPFCNVQHFNCIRSVQFFALPSVFMARRYLQDTGTETTIDSISILYFPP